MPRPGFDPGTLQVVSQIGPVLLRRKPISPLSYRDRRKIKKCWKILMRCINKWRKTKFHVFFNGKRLISRNVVHFMAVTRTVKWTAFCEIRQFSREIAKYAGLSVH